ncbi:hypothetical protein [Croceibacterium aestuarii]|uniref:hypothetical protein n=1 Tax=Croceibacterium aestuarii TaxID=3064139 RepID=UPI00272E054B|nr:hypothetical protein [Croceibacterium sp. D39]
MNGPILIALGLLLIGWGLYSAAEHQFVLTAVLAAFGGAAVVWGAKMRKDTKR